MPKENERKDAAYARMTTGELEALLSQDLEEQTLSAEEILTVSRLLLERSPELAPRLTAQESLERHREERPRKPRRSIRRTMLIAAVLAGSMLLSMLAGAKGGAALRSVVGAWDHYGFHFVLAQPVEAEVCLGEAEDPRWQQLKQTGHAPGLTPTWLPKEVHTPETSFTERDWSRYLGYTVSYEYGDKLLWVSVESFDNKRSGRSGVTGDPLEVYCHDDVIYYVFACNERYVLLWFDDGFECHVLGLQSLEETREVLRSVINGKEGYDHETQ